MPDWQAKVFDSDLRGSDRAVALALANSAGPPGRRPSCWTSSRRRPDSQAADSAGARTAGRGRRLDPGPQFGGAPRSTRCRRKRSPSGPIA
jgi:hypothetical protein